MLEDEDEWTFDELEDALCVLLVEELELVDTLLVDDDEDDPVDCDDVDEVLTLLFDWDDVELEDVTDDDVLTDDAVDRLLLLEVLADDREDELVELEDVPDDDDPL